MFFIHRKENYHLSGVCCVGLGWFIPRYFPSCFVVDFFFMFKNININIIFHLLFQFDIHKTNKFQMRLYLLFNLLLLFFLFL